MSTDDRVTIRTLPTGVSGLDEILGGGLPEYSFNIIAGGPGTGKTTLAHQISFANASVERPVLYFTVLGEPAFKMLRYQQQFGFFNPSLLNSAIRFVNLSKVAAENDLDTALAAIITEVEAVSPAVVVVDSIRTVLRQNAAIQREADFQATIQRLALHLTSWQATTFLIGEYTNDEVRDNPLFTIADGVFWLHQDAERHSVVRRLQVMKLRGQAPVPGLHTFRITGTGLETFPRTFGLSGRPANTFGQRRLSTGSAELDDMLGGGIPEGDSLLIAGPSGSGKSVIATQFIAEGLRRGEPAIAAIFEERPEEYSARAQTLGVEVATPPQDEKFTLLYLRPLDLSVDETMREIMDAVTRADAKRLVIDSLQGFELALAPGFRTDFRESLYRMVSALTRRGVTIVSTVEVVESFNELAFSPYLISFLYDDIIRLRYVEIDAQLRKMLVVVKMRGSAHSKDLREYEVTAEGLRIGARLLGYRGLITGVAEPSNPRRADPAAPARPGKAGS